MKVYFDNAAATPLEREVLDAMLPYMRDHFGNPSSIHAFGRQARAAIESSRKTIARLLNCSPSEIFFTSGGTEANNIALRGAVEGLGIRHVVTSRIEHHAVLHTLEELERRGKTALSFLDTDSHGKLSLEQLDKILSGKEKSLVALMHANNEIGNLLPMKETAEICRKHNALFHSDTVQTVGHYNIDLQSYPVHFITCGAHKFHGPKGTGFLYIRNDVKVDPLLTGGSQERNMRGGTENVYGIVGMAKALEIACRDMQEQQRHVAGLKEYMIGQLRQLTPDVEFNGDYNGSSLYTVLNVSFPETKNREMFLFNLDIKGIAVSGGSACSSGSDAGSHVLQELGKNSGRPAVRFSFSKLNTREEIDYTVGVLKGLLG